MWDGKSEQTITHDVMEKKIMKYLYANLDKWLSKYVIYEKILDDLNIKINIHLQKDLKRKVIDILRIINSKYEDVIFDKNLELYSIKTNNNDNKSVLYANHEIVQDMSSFDYYDYIFENNLKESFTKDINGNSIWHEIVCYEESSRDVLYNNRKIMEKSILLNKIINEDKFDFEIKNNKNETPMDICVIPELNIIMLKKIVKDMQKKINHFEKEQKIKNSFSYRLYSFVSFLSLLFLIYCFVLSCCNIASRTI